MSKLALTDEQQTDLRQWAANQPSIMRMWVFGSRANGTNRPDSDLDLTVELCNDPGDSSAGLAPLMDHIDTWRDELSRLTGLVVKDIHLHSDFFGLIYEREDREDAPRVGAVLSD